MAKVINMAKITLSFYISKASGRTVHWGLPISMALEPTTACNLRCPECPSGLRAFTRPTGNLKEDFFTKTINQLSTTCCSLTLYFQGEPYVNPNFLKMVSYADQKGLYTVTSTNGHFLSEEIARRTVESGLDRLIISIDGVTQETYSSYRKEGNLQQVLEGTERIIKWKKALKSTTPYVIFQFLVVKPNEHEISQLQALATKLGVDEVKLKTAQVYDYKNGNPLIPENEKYSRYKRQPDGTYRLKHDIKNACWKMWHSAVITWDGIVVPCCFDKDAQHQMGSLRSESFANVWRGKNYQQMRTTLLRDRKSIDICTNCTEGCTVWA